MRSHSLSGFAGVSCSHAQSHTDHLTWLWKIKSSRALVKFSFFYSRDQSCLLNLNSSVLMWQDWFCFGLTCDPQLMTEMLQSNYNLTACGFRLVISKQHWITCCIWMAVWKEPANELFGVASSPVLIPLEETTQTLYIISFLQECYVVNQCRLLVTVFPSNFTSNSFFCCIGSLVRQTKLQCFQVCW